MKLVLIPLVIVLTVIDIAAQDRKALNDSTQAVPPVVDVRALARQQIEMANNGQRALESRQSALPNETNPLIPILFFMVTLLATIGALWLVVRKPPEHRSPVKRPATLPVQPQTPRENPVDALLRQAQLILLEKKAQRTLPTPLKPQPIDTNITIARTFGRGKGELALAHKLETSDKQYSWEQKIRNNDSLLTGESTAASARSLGVGTGELKLLHTLRSMQAQQRKERS